MNIWGWIGKKIRLTDGQFWSAYFGGDNWANRTVTTETALQVATFWSCVRLISQTIGTLPLGLYERQADGGRAPVGEHPLYSVLHDQPNADQTAVEFWEAMTAGLCIQGNGFSEKIETSAGVVGLGRPFYCTSVYRTPEGALRYRLHDRGKNEELPEEKVFHIRGFGLGGDLGLSPLAYARQTLGNAMATDEASARTFANGMRAGGWLKYKGGTLSPEQRDQARKALIEPMQGVENAGKTGVLEGDFDWQPAVLNPEDAQMLDSRRFNIEELCRWLGVPPILIGHAGQGQTMWGSGVEQIMIGWLTLGLRPYLTRIEQAIKRSLIKPSERGRIYPEFTVEGLLRADNASRGEFYWKLAQLAAITPNQICDKENFPRFEGGNVRLINSTLMPLEGSEPQRDSAPPQRQRRLEVVK